MILYAAAAIEKPSFNIDLKRRALERKSPQNENCPEIKVKYYMAYINVGRNQFVTVKENCT